MTITHRFYLYIFFRATHMSSFHPLLKITHMNTEEVAWIFCAFWENCAYTRIWTSPFLKPPSPWLKCLHPLANIEVKWGEKDPWNLTPNFFLSLRRKKKGVATTKATDLPSSLFVQIFGDSTFRSPSKKEVPFPPLLFSKKKSSFLTWVAQKLRLFFSNFYREKWRRVQTLFHNAILLLFLLLFRLV